MLPTSRWGKFTFYLYLFFIHLLALFFVLEKVNGRKDTALSGNEQAANAFRDSSANVIDSANIHLADSAVTAFDHAPDIPPTVYGDISSDTGKLIIPVAGVKRKDLQDNYTQSRSGGRIHNAIDIMAPEGTPVVAVADGEIAKFFESKQGGITIYQWSVGRKRVYYYAHLKQRAAGIAEKLFVKRGTIIGYVGNTGNAGAGNYHLHFSIMLPTTPDRHWEGTDINPYPLLKDGIEIPAQPQ